LTLARQLTATSRALLPLIPIGPVIAFVHARKSDALLNIVIALIVVGVALYLVNRTSRRLPASKAS
jgi:hypothetical protein